MVVSVSAQAMHLHNQSTPGSQPPLQGIPNCRQCTRQLKSLRPPAWLLESFFFYSSTMSPVAQLKEHLTSIHKVPGSTASWISVGILPLFGVGTKPGLWPLDWSSNTELTSNITTQVSYILDKSYLIVYTTFNVLKLVSSLSNSTLGYLLQRNQFLEFMCLHVSCSVVLVNYNFTY